MKQQEERTSLWKRFRRLLGSSRAEESSEKQAHEQRAADAHEPFSMLELQDRVVVMLIFDQVVRVEQVAAAWRYWKDEAVDTADALWRVVARLPGVEAEVVFARAARVYAFDPVDFNMYGACGLIRKRRRTLSHAKWERMVNLNVAPVRTVYDEEKDAPRWIFATHDPARPAVKRLLEELNVASYALRYAPRKSLEEVFDEALPRLARERPEPRPLPGAPEALPPREESRRLLKNLAHGTPSAKAAAGASRSSDTAPASAAELFDRALAGVAQSSARAAYLFGNAQGQLEIYHRRRRSFRHWRTEAHVSADAMIDFISGRILSLRAAQKQSEEAVERWVAGRALAFRPSIEPAHHFEDALPVQAGAEVVVIELLR